MSGFQLAFFSRYMPFDYLKEVASQVDVVRQVIMGQSGYAFTWGYHCRQRHRNLAVNLGLVKESLIACKGRVLQLEMLEVNSFFELISFCSLLDRLLLYGLKSLLADLGTTLHIEQRWVQRFFD